MISDAFRLVGVSADTVLSYATVVWSRYHLLLLNHELILLGIIQLIGPVQDECDQSDDESGNRERSLFLVGICL